jgi:transposase
VLTRDEAAAFFGVSLNTWTTWEHEGRVTIPRYRAASGTGRPIYYAPDDLTRLREEFRRSEEPHEDPDRPGVYRVPIRSRLHTLHALIDAQDLPKVRGKNWNWSPGRKVANAERTGEVLLATMGTQTPLKRIILGLEHAGKDTNIVYANGDPLDCRRGNLVVRSNSEKNVARGKSAPRSACSSKYKGVHFDPKRCRWVAQIASAGKHAFLGRFEDEVEAALAYDTAARGLLGPHAYLNFPDPNAAPPRTGNDPRGNPVRDKQKYTVTPPLPPPPEGVAVADRERAAELMGVSADTFHHWVNAGRITIPRYRVKAVTGTPILYAVVDLERLRDQFAKEGQPFPDPQDANTWRVPIWTKRGFIEALVDAQDQPIVQGRTWNYTKRKGMGDETGVVILVGERGIEREVLKRLIMSVRDAGVGVSVVHANGNPLDCRRGNLVVRTQAQKVRRAFKNTHRCGEPCTSIYKGVCWLERYGKWQAQIRVDDKPRNLGLFDDELDAACAYDEAAREVWGEEARVNFPEKGELPTAMRGPAKNEPAGKLAA